MISRFIAIVHDPGQPTVTTDSDGRVSMTIEANGDRITLSWPDALAFGAWAVLLHQQAREAA